MAQTLKLNQEEQEQEQRKEQQEAFKEQQGEIQSHSDNREGFKALHRQSKSLRKSLCPQIGQQSSADCELNPNTSISNLNQRYQPSKIFLSKCRAELEALLTAIKDTYHLEIKNLYNEQLHADFFIQFGVEEFKKPLHRCVIASRAYKLYRTLKAFKLVEVPIEKDIIISEFQEKLIIENTDIENKIETEDDKETRQEDQEEVAEEVKEDSILHCDLPDDLISPDLLLNFVRRVYLDQDISEEENNLNRKLIDWLKENRPELIKAPKRSSPNHRESFRTIQPDYEESSAISTKSHTSATMSPEQLINLNDNDDIELDEASQSIRDTSLTGSSLTRTETFELLTRSNNIDDSTPGKNILTDSNDEKGTEVVADNAELESESPSVTYAPTTRTGLKPKTFTTPVGLRLSNRSTSSSKQISKIDDLTTKTKPTRSNATKQASSDGKNSTLNVSKRTSLSSDVTSDKGQVSGSKLQANQKSNKTATSTSKLKPTMITRAQPISMERSQSPGTNVIKTAPTRNFIAANKRLISQIEKKHSIMQQNSPETTANQNETSDAESNADVPFVFESLTSENLVANMDKFTLMSLSKLADSLSRMFIDGLLTDAIINTKEDAKQIKAHKCILAARSAYLAEFLANKRLPSTDSCTASSQVDSPICIDLTEYTYPVVYFCMMHIYSGIVKVPEDLDIEELTKLTHHLHVSTLTQVCLQNLRMNYCHFFHKPCNVCCVGVLKTLPLAWRYDYTELYSKCLQWIGSNFASIFHLKEFSELKPHDLLEECYSATLSQLNPDNIIPKTIECQKLLKNLPRVKWTESIICMVGRLLEDFCHYVADNYEKILQSESFINLGKNCWECEILEENLLAAMNHLKPDSGCKTLIQLHRIECSLESCSDESRNVSDSLANLVSKMRKYCERYLLKEATAVVHCSSWRHMSPSLQKRIKDQAIIATDFDEPTKQLASKPKLPSMSRHQQVVSPSEGKSPRSTPDSKSKSPSTTFLPQPKSKTAAARHVKVLK